jgi:hypothetical protein
MIGIRPLPSHLKPSAAYWMADCLKPRLPWWAKSALVRCGRWLLTFEYLHDKSNDSELGLTKLALHDALLQAKKERERQRELYKELCLLRGIAHDLVVNRDLRAREPWERPQT